MEINAKSVGGLLKDINIFLDGSNLSGSSLKSYKQIIDSYLKWLIYVYNSIEARDVFKEKNIAKYREERKSIIVRSVHLKLLDYFVGVEEISKEESYPIKQIISDIYHEDKQIIAIKFLTKNEVDDLFHKVIYKDDTEKLQAQIIFMLSFYLFLEQKDIAALKIQDYIQDKSLLKNSIVAKDGYEKQWLTIPPMLKEIIDKYLNDIPEPDTNEIYLLSKSSKPFENGDFNRICSRTKTNINSVNFREGYFPVNVQMLIKSGLLHSLQETNGSSLFHIISVCSYTQHVKDAIKRYFEWTQAQNLDLEQNNSFVDILSGFTSIANDDYYENNEDNKSRSGNEYSKDKDITLELLMSYDSFNNQKTTEISIERLVRNTNKAEILKKLYENKCQLCGYRLFDDKGGYYSEAHHIRPYNKTHLGDDVESNMVVLCPNCHVLFDKLVYAINPKDGKVNCLYEEDKHHLSELKFMDNHVLDNNYLEYVWNLFLEKKKNLTLIKKSDI